MCTQLRALIPRRQYFELQDKGLVARGQRTPPASDSNPLRCAAMTSPPRPPTAHAVSLRFSGERQCLWGPLSTSRTSPGRPRATRPRSSRRGGSGLLNPPQAPLPPPPTVCVWGREWGAQGCIGMAVHRRRRRGSPPPAPRPPLPMFEADCQNFASAPSVPRGLKLQKFWPAFGGDRRGTLGGGGRAPHHGLGSERMPYGSLMS